MGVRKLLAGLSRNVLIPYGLSNSRESSTSPSDSNATLRKKEPKDSKSRNANIEKILTHGSKNVKIVTLLGSFFIILITLVTLFRPFSGADLPQCQGIYMYPSYARIDGFDTRYTPLAKKYHLYLYREQGKDKIPANNTHIKLDGIPVLFIPGNAGSFRQVRSIASACANKYFDSPNEIMKENAKNLDFFAADFNEDYTAFHGGTMLDQAEYLNDAIRYILELYEQTNGFDGRPIPKSVLILGHSMGGMVARVMPTLRNHIHGSINSIITLSTPHGAAPVTFDGDILKIYKKTNDYWRAQYADKDSFFSKHVSLISITGGILDTVLPADYAMVSDLIPPENGFTTFTTTIPGVWTPIDHLAIVWCKQLREVIATLLLETVDDSVPDKTVSLEERMHISKKLLLSGFEDYSMNEKAILNPSTYGKIMDTDFSMGMNLINLDDQFTITKENIDSTEAYSKIFIPTEGDNFSFTLLTSLANPKVRFCKEHVIIKNIKDLKCASITDDISVIPNSFSINSYAADSSFANEQSPFKMLSYDKDILSQYDFIIIEKPNELDDDSDFLTAILTMAPTSRTIPIKPRNVMFFGHTISLNTNTLAVEELELPELWDSLISYKIQASVENTKEKPLLFEPLIRQSVDEPFETKWHLGLGKDDIDVSVHNVAPFIPLNETKPRPIRLSVIMPPNINVHLKLKINWLLTIKLLFIRYRLAIASFPIFIIALAMAYQFHHYNETAIFLSFHSSLSYIIQEWGFFLLFVLFILSPIVNNRTVQRILYLLDPLKLNRPFLLEKEHIHANFYYLGIQEWFASGLGTIFGLMSFALLYVLAAGLALIEKSVHYFSKNRPEGLVEATTPNCPPMDTKLFQKKHIIPGILLNIMVISYIPYQLAFIMLFLAQVVICIKIGYMKKCRDYANIRNYNMSILVLFLFVSIIDAPIIIVFLHNVGIRWETSFRSHHNILSVTPIILLVCSNANLNIPSRVSSNSFDGKVTIALLLYSGIFSLIYGLRNLYWVHDLLNIISAWLFYSILRNRLMQNKPKELTNDTDNSTYEMNRLSD
ncbi:Bst1p NDAI_0G03190 [Naumovozyma dairenensis CBS 421]|uniref:GPI inositol-deacylase n=1 Tax=Naumovozyma dairenensis (strain ATCC 10597 / BCRC 20456 / CBS 421 / NBRC 0211 / NRRL Y-12639) TaxID=1071378 RepID=G0WE85_NAUDC|nr:hypothetical protein NDAI_0G03190 [Naumovozyma dairenensis CBS 421]CCD26096.2 hypothetical protein NDAI_0G03190 [Naumovozyma dairenensis CBS 421]